MSQGRRVTSSELEGPGVQAHVGEQGRGAGYAHPESGLDRNSLRKGALPYAPDMGTAQQPSSAARSKGDFLDMIAGRDLVVSPRPSSIRQAASSGGSGSPVVVPHLSSARAFSRQPPPSAPFGAGQSPRSYNSTSYRDAALAAAKHGLSAYSQSATAVAMAAASRAHTPRSSGSSAAAVALGASPGRPPPAPRPTQHSAPTMTACPPANGAGGGGEFLPGCRAPSPNRGSMPPTRSGFLPSRGSGPSPCSPGRSDMSVSAVTVAAAAAAAAASSTGPSHRSDDLATVTVTCNDMWWRNAFDAGGAELDEPLPGGGGGGGGGTGRPLSGTTSGAIRVMSPGWGATPPSAYEVDGRPGTRGGGPLYDMEGRPTTRGGQRPPSRAQLMLMQQRPPAHVAPLGPGWAGLFAGGCGTVSGEAGGAAATTSMAASAAQYVAPRAPSASASLSWSGDPMEQLGTSRRQLMPLPPAPLPFSVPRIGSPPATRGIGLGAGAGVLASLPPPPPTAASHSLHQQQPGSSSPTLLLPVAPGSSSSSSSNGGSAGTGASRTPLGTKLSSIAESPSSPVLLPLPPQLQQQLHSRDSLGRLEGGSSGRKAPREREASFTYLVTQGNSPNAARSLFSCGLCEEEGADDGSRLCSLDQDSGGSGGGSPGGSGRLRLRCSSSSTLEPGGGDGGGCGGRGVREHCSPIGELLGSRGGDGGASRSPVAGLGSPTSTEESPSTRPRR